MLTSALAVAQPVEVSDELAEGAAYAVAQLTQQSNSLIPWTLKEVVDAKRIAEGVYQVSLRVVRGQEEKVFQVNRILLSIPTPLSRSLLSIGLSTFLTHTHSHTHTGAHTLSCF
jgi:hypothetical protein